MAAPTYCLASGPPEHAQRGVMWMYAAVESMVSSSLGYDDGLGGVRGKEQCAARDDTPHRQDPNRPVPCLGSQARNTVRICAYLPFPR